MVNKSTLSPDRYRYSLILLKQLIKTDFKLRYQGSFLGYLWSLLKPFALFATLYVVFSVFLKFGDAIPYYNVYLLLGIVIWNYFGEVTNNSVKIIVGQGDLIRKINFPRYVILLASSISAFINFSISMVVVFIFMYFNNITVGWSALWLPLIIVQLFLLSIGAAFFLSTAYVKLRDISHIWEVLLQAAFYATPILYPVALIVDYSPEVAKLFMLNPMAQIIQDARFVLITDKTENISQVWGSYGYRAIPVLLTLVIFVLSAWYFKTKSKSFAEEI